MKRIIASLAMIVLVGFTTVSATRAYFTDTVQVTGNTFATGTVDLNRDYMWGLPLTVTGLGPGLSQSKNVDIQYLGSLPADLYVGVGGTSAPGQAAYIADHVVLGIFDRVVLGYWFNDKTNLLSTNWIKIATNVNQNEIKYYRLDFTMDTDTPDFHQGISNTDTKFIFYAVQAGTPGPTGLPYMFP
jgi:predicted ribosomally synthesized peptide with SipW-like signal peptide